MRLGGSSDWIPVFFYHRRTQVETQKIYLENEEQQPRRAFWRFCLPRPSAAAVGGTRLVGNSVPKRNEKQPLRAFWQFCLPRPPPPDPNPNPSIPKGRGQTQTLRKSRVGFTPYPSESKGLGLGLGGRAGDAKSPECSQRLFFITFWHQIAN